MTKFEKDLQEALAGYSVQVLVRRKREIDNLKRELSVTKNSFRRTAIQQEIDRLTKEYNDIDTRF